MLFWQHVTGSKVAIPGNFLLTACLHAATGAAVGKQDDGASRICI